MIKAIKKWIVNYLRDLSVDFFRLTHGLKIDKKSNTPKK